MASADKIAPKAQNAHRVPIFGAIAHELSHRSVHFPLYVILVVLVVWGIAIALWGLPALFLPAVVFSPIMLGILVMIGRG